MKSHLTNERKKYKTHSPILLRTSFGTFVVFCPGLPVCVCDLCCEAKRNYSMMTIWRRLHDSEYLFIYWNFSSISICSFVFSFARFAQRICLARTLANAEWETSEKWIKWQWYCVLVTTKQKKNRWTNETASIKILSFFSCEIRMRCLRNHCLHCCQVRPVLTDSQLLQKYRVSSLFLRLRLSPSLSRRSLHFLWKELFSLERSRWVVCLSARNSTENAMTDLSVRARHRRHATPAREREKQILLLLVTMNRNEMKWNENKEGSICICVCSCEVNAIASAARLYKVVAMVKGHWSASATDSGSDSSSRCSRHRRRRKLFIFWQRSIVD